MTTDGGDSLGAIGALVAVSRLLATATEGEADDIHATIIGEACECFGS